MTRLEPVRGDRSAWLAWRRQGIGASDMAGLLGISRWSSPWSVWADKSGLLPINDDDGASDKMRFGQRAEPMIVPWFEEETGLHVAAQQILAQNDERPWMLATPDGAVFETPPASNAAELMEHGFGMAGLLGGLEIKVDTIGKRWAVIPEYYQAQGQWQMAVTGWERVWFAVLHGWRLEVYELERDQADIDFMIERAERFWADHVLTGDPPPVDDTDATAAALAAVYPGRTPEETIELDDDVIGWLDKLAQAKKDQADAKRAGKRASAEIRARIGSYTYATVGGVQVASLKSQTRTTTCQHCGHSETGEPFRVLRPTKGIRT